MDVVICVEFCMKYRCTEFGLPLVGALEKKILLERIVLKWVLYSSSLEEGVDMFGYVLRVVVLCEMVILFC